MFVKITGTLLAISILLMPALASAHVTVMPDKATVAQRQIFSISVPNEEETEVTNIKLDIPAGLDDEPVRPDSHRHAVVSRRSALLRRTLRRGRRRL